MPAFDYKKKPPTKYILMGENIFKNQMFLTVGNHHDDDNYLKRLIMT